MKPNIYIKNLSRFCATTILIMSFTRGIAAYALSFLNMAVWIAVTLIERRKMSESDSTDASKWYSRYGRKLLTDLITDLNTRGIKRLTIDESGEIRISEDEHDRIKNFPQKSAWLSLICELEDEGLRSSIDGDSLVIAW